MEGGRDDDVVDADADDPDAENLSGFANAADPWSLTIILARIWACLAPGGGLTDAACP